LLVPAPSGNSLELQAWKRAPYASCHKVHCRIARGIHGMHDCKSLPSIEFLIIDDDMGLRKEPDKAVFDAKGSRGTPSVLGSHCAPTVEFCARGGESFCVLYHAWDRHGFGARGADQCVIEVNVYDELRIGIQWRTI
jgi:hypothetical protein